jgi:dTDP-4-dehydrorhamnose reductase
VKEILITGASGMLGSDVAKGFPQADLLCGKNDLDFSSLFEVERFLKIKKYDCIIHCAALTDTRKCEANRETAEKIHSDVVDIFNTYSRKLIYISTVPVWDYYPYVKSIYFETKRAGEIKTLSKKENIVIRANIYGKGGLSDWFHEGSRSGRKMHGYSEVFFNPVHTTQLSFIIERMVSADSNGVFSVSSDKVLSKYAFLEEMKIRCDITNTTFVSSNTIKQDLTIKNADMICSHEEGMNLLTKEYENK